jgi:hypothetical protein
MIPGRGVSATVAKSLASRVALLPGLGVSVLGAQRGFTVAGHFGSIGFAFGDQREFAAGIVELARIGAVQRLDEEERDHIWTDASGARTVILTRGGSIQEMLPCLVAGAEPIKVREAEMLGVEVARVNLLTDDGQDICPLLVELEDRALLSRVSKVDEGRLRLAALAEEIVVHGDADAYYASQDGDGPKFAADHLIPAGMFGPEPRALAILAAEVIDAHSRTNTMTGVPFHWLRVRGISGIEFDVAVQHDLLAAVPEPGNVVSGSFFMTGSLGLDY